MMKKIFVYVVNGWANDDASLLNVFVTLIALFIVILFISFFLFGWMMFVY